MEAMIASMNVQKIYFKMGFLALAIALLIPTRVHFDTAPSIILSTAQAAFTCPSPLVTGVDSGGVTTCTDPNTGDSYNYDDSTGQTVTTGVGGVQASTGSQVDAKGTVIPPNNCGLFSPGTWFQQCIWIPLLSSLGSWFLTIGGSILELSGLLFDILINAVIVGFGSSLNSLGITAAITTGWDAFRDLSNILIIGMFVFIAISTILGSKEYGYKKLVARVLIIAVLMNFSLLFTKLVIDASNLTAFQFYNQLSGQTAQNNTSQTFDTAAAFLAPMGITSVWNDSKNLTSYVGNTTGSGAQAFLVGLIGGIMLLIIAGVLFYAVFLIGTRAVVLVILMLTSSVAFATYLIPNFAGSKYGWKGWWEALINCAIFAPLLMLFLSLSLLIIHGALPANAALSGNTNLGTIISDPSSLMKSGNQGWQIIMTYLVTIGLLFVSLKISSRFASTTSGMDFGSLLAGKALSMTAGVGGAFGRNTVGWGSSAIGDRLRAKASALLAIPKEDQTWRSRFATRALYSASKPFKDIAKSDFNPAQKKSKGGYEGRQKARADEYAKMAEDLDRKKHGMTDEAVRKEAGEKVMKEQPHLAEEKKAADAGVIAADKAVKEAIGQQKTAFEEVGKNIINLQSQHAAARAEADADPMNTDKKRIVDSKLQALEEERAKQKGILNDQDNRIKEAKIALDQAKQTQTDIQAIIQKAAEVSGAIKIDLKKSTKQNAAELAHHRFSNILTRAAGISTPENDRLAQLAGKQSDEHHKKHAREKTIEALGLGGGHDDGHGESKAPVGAAAAGHGPASPGGAPGAAAGGGDHD